MVPGRGRTWGIPARQQGCWLTRRKFSPKPQNSSLWVSGRSRPAVAMWTAEGIRARYATHCIYPGGASLLVVSHQQRMGRLGWKINLVDGLTGANTCSMPVPTHSSTGHCTTAPGRLPWLFPLWSRQVQCGPRTIRSESHRTPSSKYLLNPLSRSLLRKGWFTAQLGACENCRLSGPTPELPNRRMAVSDSSGDVYGHRRLRMPFCEWPREGRAAPLERLPVWSGRERSQI